MDVLALSDHLSIGVLSSGDTSLIRIEGDLDLTTAPLLAAAAEELVAAGARQVVIDCGHLGFCDSGGLSTFMAIRRLPGVESVTLARLSPTVRRLLEVTGIESAFGLSPY